LREQGEGGIGASQIDRERRIGRLFQALYSEIHQLAPVGARGWEGDRMHLALPTLRLERVADRYEEGQTSEGHVLAAAALFRGACATALAYHSPSRSRVARR
jgi:hypothetical protein